jgi:hypothetical protein
MFQMSDWYYAVRLGRFEDARLGENWLVQLICEDHQNLKSHEGSCEAAACKIAMDAFKIRYPWEDASMIKCMESSRYVGEFSEDRWAEPIIADCRCRAWYNWRDISL